MFHKMFSPLAALLVAAGTVIGAEEPKREEAIAGFNQLLTASQEANKTVEKNRSVIQKGGVAQKLVIDSRIQGPPCQIAGNPCRSAVKFWVEILDADRHSTGKFVDPSKYKWQRNEPFRLWFESAVPVIAALYQTYPDPKPSEQIVPDKEYSETYTVIPAGEKFCFPVNLRTDDNLVDEHLSLILVRADATMTDVQCAVVAAPVPVAVNAPAVGNANDSQIAQIVVNGNNNNISTGQNKDDSVHGNNNSVTLTKEQDILWRGVKKCSEDFDKAAAKKGGEPVTKCRIFGPRRPVVIHEVPVPVPVVVRERVVVAPPVVLPEEAAFVMLTTGKVAQTQIVLHKD